LPPEPPEPPPTPFDRAASESHLILSGGPLDGLSIPFDPAGRPPDEIIFRATGLYDEGEAVYRLDVARLLDLFETISAGKIHYCHTRESELVRAVQDVHRRLVVAEQEVDRLRQELAERGNQAPRATRRPRRRPAE
jgi:hypothetical protein